MDSEQETWTVSIEDATMSGLREILNSFAFCVPIFSPDLTVPQTFIVLLNQLEDDDSDSKKILKYLENQKAYLIFWIAYIM